MVDRSSLALIKAGVRSTDLTVVTLERSYHVATLDYDAELIFTDLERVLPAAGQKEQERAATPSEDDREAIDRAFADLVAGYHLTADRPDPPEPRLPLRRAGRERGAGRVSWADQHPLFRFTEPPPPAEPAAEPEPEDAYVPEPLPPLSRPGVAGAARLGSGSATRCCWCWPSPSALRLPAWAGWLAVVSFLAGFGILVTRLPRQPSARRRRRRRAVAGSRRGRQSGSRVGPATRSRRVPAARRACACAAGARSRSAAESGGSTMACRARSAAPISPASLRKWASTMPRLLAEAAPGQGPAERVLRRQQQQVPGRADPAADHHHLRVQRRGQVGDAPTEPRPDVSEQLDRVRLALQWRPPSRPGR